MRLLVLSSRPPWPPIRADQLTVDRLVRYLASRGDEVDLACFVESEEEDALLRDGLGRVVRTLETVRLPRWRSFLATAASLPTHRPMQVGYFHHRTMRELVERLVARNRYDLVYAHLIRMAEYARRLDVPKILGVQIAQALNYRRMGDHARNPTKRLFYRIEERKVRPYEVAASRDFDRVLLVGQRDIDEMKRTGPMDNAVVCPHGQDIPPIDRVRSASREPDTIVISGVMATNTNVDAVTWFAREMFPLIERQVPSARFWIVGRFPARAVAALSRPPKVVVTGEVPDVYDWLCRASVAVDPLRMGAGMQNKVIQSMACELPVVLTSVANEGIGAVDGVHALLRDEPASFAAAVVDLLKNTPKRVELGEAARKFVESTWTWEMHFDRLRALMDQVASRAS